MRCDDERPRVNCSTNIGSHGLRPRVPARFLAHIPHPIERHWDPSMHGCRAAFPDRLSCHRPRPRLAKPTPHLLQGRAQRGRNQSALRDYQLPRSRLTGLRFLQRSRRRPARDRASSDPTARETRVPPTASFKLDGIATSDRGPREWRTKAKRSSAKRNQSGLDLEKKISLRSSQSFFS